VRHLSVRRIGAGALALALSACHGPDQIVLGGTGMVTPANPAFLSPKGDDQNSGAQDAPWKTFKEALPRLGPGSTLTLLEGTYDRGTTGFIDARCVDGDAGPSNARSGTDDTPAGRVTINAVGHVFLRGDDGGPPLSITGCAHWVIDGLHAEGADLDTAPNTPEVGSVVVVGNDTHDLTLRHLLLARPNVYRHAHVLHIGEGSHDVLVEDCELYEFHENAVETARTSNLTFRRNYINSRGKADKIFPTAYQAGGDFGFLFEETSGVLAENNLVENVHDGFGIVGRDLMLDSAAPPANPPDGNRLLGNIVLQPEGVGVRIDSRCNGENPCPPSRTVRRTDFVDTVVIGGAAGLSSAGATGTTIQRFTVTGAANGLLFIKEPKNAALQSSSMTKDSLAIVQDNGFRANDEAGWSFDHCAVMSSNPAAAFVPDDPGHVTGKVNVMPDLGACLAFIPETSALKHAGTGAGAVGADVLDRYENGQLTSTPLWTAAGSFPCGAVVTDLNADLNTSCAGVGTRRLQITPAGSQPSMTSCPLP
jgi:hypothetical protein